MNKVQSMAMSLIVGARENDEETEGTERLLADALANVTASSGVAGLASMVSQIAEQLAAENEGSTADEWVDAVGVVTRVTGRLRNGDFAGASEAVGIELVREGEGDE